MQFKKGTYNNIFKVESTISQLDNNFRKPLNQMNLIESFLQFLSKTLIVWNIHVEFYICDK